VASNGDRFCDDAEHWVEDPHTTRSLGIGGHEQEHSSLPNPTLNFSAFGQDTDKHELVYSIIRGLHMSSMLITDATFSRQGDSQARGFFKLQRGLYGVFTTFWAAAFSFPYFMKRVGEVQINGVGIDTKTRHFSHTHLAGLVMGMLGDTITLVGGAARCYSGSVSGIPLPSPGTSGTGRRLPTAGPARGNLPSGAMDYVELFITVGNAALACYQIRLQADALSNSIECSDQNPDGDVRDAARLIRKRYILVSIPKLVGWMFTQTPAGRPLDNPYFKAVVTAVRLGANGGALGCHMAALTDKLDV
jgi:hypothetical protein